MFIKKHQTKKLILALITNLNSKITSLSEQLKTEIDTALEESSRPDSKANALLLQDFAGIKNLTISFTIGGVFVLLKNFTDYDNHAKIKKNQLLKRFMIVLKES